MNKTTIFLNKVKAGIVDLVTNKVEETADGIMATFTDAVEALDTVAEKAIAEVGAHEAKIQDILVVQAKAADEVAKAKRYAKNLRSVLEA